jgi:hypothetical protein
MGPVHVFVEASNLERARELVASTEALPVEVDE